MSSGGDGNFNVLLRKTNRAKDVCKKGKVPLETTLPSDKYGPALRTERELGNIGWFSCKREEKGEMGGNE